MLWVQDESCHASDACVNEDLPAYDESESSSVRSVFCNEIVCLRSLNTLTFCDQSVHNYCTYGVAYADDTSTGGYIKYESMEFFGGWPVRSITVENVPLGFGVKNTVKYPDAVGIMGLSAHKGSFIEALKIEMFSFCLPEPYRSGGGLKFGSEAEMLGNSNAMIEGEPLYSLELHKFILNNEHIQELDDSKVIFDTGTSLTLVPENVFNLILQKLNKFINLEKRGEKIYCGYGKNIPVTIKWKFQELEIVSNLESIFIQVSHNEGGTISCLNMNGHTSNKIIFGCLFMQNINFGINTITNRMFIHPRRCGME
ncbi:hypothetical protein LUZ63_016273 [Rhynchospora breviuscula]|uniref:Peptidase A1 domain-containing protein n=1 Tax=Rhynchospora breviuscula TaxID=2022672 RepID=A0A9P9ZA37_9POAL|nr:hypothetical protein LUZ63_016273 [Rhynchospora breviuscula]